jgi:glutamate/tyrosine decarboxylase-like PLP-dependent enzyme
MALAQYGQAGYAEMLEHQTHMGDVLRKLLAASGWRVVNSTPLPIVCFTRDGLVPAKLCAELRERQIAWMSEAQIHGIPVMRASITSFRTTEKHIEWVVSKMNALISSAMNRDTALQAN